MEHCMVSRKRLGEGSFAKSLSLRLFLTLHLCHFGFKNLKIVVA